MAEPAKRSARKAEPARRARGADQDRSAAVVAEGSARARRRMARRDRRDRRRQGAQAASRRRCQSRAARKLAGLVAAIAEALAVSVGPDPRRSGALPRRARSRSGGHFAGAVAAVTRAGLAEQDEAEMMRVLRRGKAEAALLIALADIGGVWPVERVTRALTAFADAAAGAAVRFLLRGCRRAGQACAAQSRGARGGQRLRRARDGQDGRARAQLFERYRPDRSLRRERAGARAKPSSRPRCSCASRAGSSS